MIPRHFHLTEKIATFSREILLSKLPCFISFQQLFFLLSYGIVYAVTGFFI